MGGVTCSKLSAVEAEWHLPPLPVPQNGAPSEEESLAALARAVARALGVDLGSDVLHRALTAVLVDIVAGYAGADPVGPVHWVRMAVKALRDCCEQRVFHGEQLEGGPFHRMALALSPDGWAALKHLEELDAVILPTAGCSRDARRVIGSLAAAAVGRVIEMLLPADCLDERLLIDPRQHPLLEDLTLHTMHTLRLTVLCQSGVKVKVKGPGDVDLREVKVLSGRKSVAAVRAGDSPLLKARIPSVRSLLGRASQKRVLSKLRCDEKTGNYSLDAGHPDTCQALALEGIAAALSLYARQRGGRWTELHTTHDLLQETAMGREFLSLLPPMSRISLSGAHSRAGLQALPWQTEFNLTGWTPRQRLWTFPANASLLLKGVPCDEFGLAPGQGFRGNLAFFEVHASLDPLRGGVESAASARWLRFSSDDAELLRRCFERIVSGDRSGYSEWIARTVGDSEGKTAWGIQRLLKLVGDEYIRRERRFPVEMLVLEADVFTQVLGTPEQKGWYVDFISGLPLTERNRERERIQDELKRVGGAHLHDLVCARFAVPVQVQVQGQVAADDADDAEDPEDARAR